MSDVEAYVDANGIFEECPCVFDTCDINGLALTGFIFQTDASFLARPQQHRQRSDV